MNCALSVYDENGTVCSKTLAISQAKFSAIIGCKL